MIKARLYNSNLHTSWGLVARNSCSVLPRITVCGQIPLFIISFVVQLEQLPRRGAVLSYEAALCWIRLSAQSRAVSTSQIGSSCPRSQTEVFHIICCLWLLTEDCRGCIWDLLYTKEKLFHWPPHPSPGKYKTAIPFQRAFSVKKTTGLCDILTGWATLGNAILWLFFCGFRDSWVASDNRWMWDRNINAATNYGSIWLPSASFSNL